MASRNAGESTLISGSGATAMKAPSIASSGRWSIQLIFSCHHPRRRMIQYPPPLESLAISATHTGCPAGACHRAGHSGRTRWRGMTTELFGRAQPIRQPRIGNIARVEPRRIGPAVLVILGHTLLGERRHLVERAGAARIPQRLDADVLVIAGV